MRRLAVFSVACGLMAVLGGAFFVPSAEAIPGDVNGDGIINIGDVVYLISYLFKGGPPPPNPIDADIDGSPGINIGDVLQLTGRSMADCDLLPYTGASVRVGSDIRFSSDLIFSMDTLGNVGDTTEIRIIENAGPDLMGMVIPLSFANQPHEVEVVLNSVSFAGTIIPPDWSIPPSVDNTNNWPVPLSVDDFSNWSMPVASMDDDNKTVLFSLFADNPTDTPIDSGTTGLVATLFFTKIVDGDPLALSSTEISPSHSFVLISSYCADTTGGVSPSERIFTPKLSLALHGDVNCDGVVQLGDLVYLVNYLYKGGPPPCGL
jgi:hypothetical protein